jgi:hypothetical protein
MSGNKRYVDAVLEKWQVRPVLPFGEPINIGDVGHINDDGGWEPVTTLKERLHVEVQGIRVGPPSGTVWDLQSGHEVKFDVKAQGQTSTLFPNAANAHARTEVSLGKSDSFVFAARDVAVTTATELTEVLKKIRHAYHERKHLSEQERWDKDYAYVFATADAADYTAIVAQESDTTVAVEASGDVPLPQAPAGLAAGVQFSASNRSYQHANQTPAEHCFFRAYKLHPRLFKRWDREEQVLAVAPMNDEQWLAYLDSLDLAEPDHAFYEVGVEQAQDEASSAGVGS